MSVNKKKVFTTGRPPWYDHQGIKCPLVIGVAGSFVYLQLISITYFVWFYRRQC